MLRTRLFVLLLLPSLALGQNVKYLQKDEPAPFTGYLFTPEAEKEIFDQGIDLEATKEELSIQKEENEALQRRLEVWKKASEDMALQVVKQERRNFWENSLYFIAGAVITGVVAAGAARAVR